MTNLSNKSHDLNFHSQLILVDPGALKFDRILINYQVNILLWSAI